MRPELQERPYVLQIFPGPAPVHCHLQQPACCLSVGQPSALAIFFLPIRQTKEKKRKERTQRGGTPAALCLDAFPQPCRLPAVLRHSWRDPLPFPTFTPSWRFSGALLSLADSKPAAAQFVPHRGFIHPLTNLVVVVCRLPGVDRRCEHCRPIVVVRGMPSADR